MLSKPVFLRVPRVIDADVLSMMEDECDSIEDARLDELLELVPGPINDWTDHLDIKKFEKAKSAHEKLLDALNANGGRGVELAEEVDAAASDMDMLEFAAKRKFLSKHLRTQLRNFVYGIAYPLNSPRNEASIIDLDHQTQWVFIAVDEDSQYADGLRLLDRSHVCRIDRKAQVVNELVNEFSVDRHSVERMLGEHFRQLPIEELLYKAQDYFDRKDLMEAAEAVEEE